MEQQSIALKLSQNSFDYFRLFAAFQVMFGHMVSLYEIKLPFYIPLRFIGGVPILFTLCGFLVTASYAKSKNVGEYFKKKVLSHFSTLVVQRMDWLCDFITVLQRRISSRKSSRVDIPPGICFAVYARICKGIR